eukprot:m.36507 g.36507  ORF g.36507 m.36507 type:complete len:80 (-) comp11026_c0_seq1:144-383(-)
MADLALQNIEEHLMDAKQVVTYGWLSNTLSIPANVAKQYVTRVTSSSSVLFLFHHNPAVSGVTTPQPPTTPPLYQQQQQ